MQTITIKDFIDQSNLNARSKKIMLLFGKETPMDIFLDHVKWGDLSKCRDCGEKTIEDIKSAIKVFLKKYGDDYVSDETIKIKMQIGNLAKEMASIINTADIDSSFFLETFNEQVMQLIKYNV